MQWMTIALGTMSLMIIVYGFAGVSPRQIEGRLLPSAYREPKWMTVTHQEMLSGVTIPADTHVIIHMPEQVSRITRKVTFGRKGDEYRYWGYEFPFDLEEADRNNRRGFPGKLFLSEAERESRRQKLITERRRTFSVFRNLTDEDLNETRAGPRSLIRHEVEILTGGRTYYVMSEEPLPVGVDLDGDGLNSALERAYSSDPDVADTDGDGINDGLEVFRLGSHPTKRDSDGDGIIDGIEDANRNGRFEPGETNATRWDTDRDGLCDGLCKVNKGQDLRGEDKNLNGIYEPDDGEYDPRKVDSDDDGILDEHEVYLCVIGGGDNC